MKSIGFVGKIDKTELIECVAKILASTGGKVIMIDATLNQKTKYTIPVIEGTQSQAQYVVEYDGIDVAVGFSNVLELKKYLLSKGEDFTNYEYVLIDTDVEEMCEEYDLKSASNLFFVTSFDKMYISKGVDLLKYICAMKRKEDPEGHVDLTKILMYSAINSADSKYIDRVTENLPLNWDKNVVNIPYDEGDLSINIQNQYSEKVALRPLSSHYKDALIEIASKITGADKFSLKKVVKNVERGA